MNKNESQPDLATGPARPAHIEPAPFQQDSVHLNADGSPTQPTLMAQSEFVMRMSEHCGGVLAKICHDIRCLQAARGGISGTSQTAANHLAHHDLKSTPLEKAEEMILMALARAEAELPTLLIEALEKQLEVEIYRADLLRCKAAIERRRESRDVYDKFKILPLASAVIARLARRGIMESHWSTVRHQTLDKIADLLLADNVAADVGSPDNPRMDWKK